MNKRKRGRDKESMEADGEIENVIVILWDATARRDSVYTSTSCSHRFHCFTFSSTTVITFICDNTLSDKNIIETASKWSDLCATCWQEVDYEHYTTRLRVSMKQLGYEGVLLQRQDDFGLATFWNTSMFQLVAQKHSVLHHLAETHLQVYTRCTHMYKLASLSCSRQPRRQCRVRLLQHSASLIATS